MKFVFIAALAVSVASPAVVTFAPTSAEAQVFTGRGVVRQSDRNRRPALSEREVSRLYDAQDEVQTLTQQVEDIQAAGEAQGGLTPDQTAQIQAHQTEIEEKQAVIDRLQAKRDRRS